MHSELSIIPACVSSREMSGEEYEMRKLSQRKKRLFEKWNTPIICTESKNWPDSFPGRLGNRD